VKSPQSAAPAIAAFETVAPLEGTGSDDRAVGGRSLRDGRGSSTLTSMPLREALGWSGVNTCVRLALGLISAKVSATYLGPPGVVLVGQVGNFIQVASGALSNGANTAVVNLTAERRRSQSRLDELWGTAMRLVLLGGAAVALAVAAAAPALSSWLLFSPDYWPIIVAAAVIVVLAVADNVVLGALNGLKKVNLVAGVGLASTVVEFGVFVSLTYWFGIWGGLYGIVAVYGTKLLVSSTIAFRSRLISLRALIGTFDGGTAREIARFYPMLLAHSIALPVAQILVRNGTVSDLGLAEGGYLQATWRLSDMYVGVLTTALGLYFMAHFAALSSEAERGAALRRTLVQVLGLTACAAFAVYWLRDVIIAVVLTHEFRPMRDILPFQLVGDVFKLLNYPLQMALVSQRRMASYIAQAVGGPAVYVALSTLLRPHTGSQAAPVAYAVSYAIVLCGLLFALRGTLAATEASRV
jgi:PST family polysaccharide transporter